MLLGGQGVISFIRDALEAWRGSGAHSVTVPPMDGPLRPNQTIEEAPALLSIEAPDNLVTIGERVVFSSGNKALSLAISGETGVATEIEQFDQPVTALAGHASGALAVALEDGRILIRGGPHTGKLFTEVSGRKIVCPTALRFQDADTLIVALGSQQNSPGRWKHDLMQRNASGSVWRIDLVQGAASCLADNLAFPYGLHIEADGGVIVSESWRNQLLRVAQGRAPEQRLVDITGFPARLSPASLGGAWLSVFAPRSQLVEFVLRERDFCNDMMAEIESEYWIAPTISAVNSFLEPLQGGALKHLGILKPWAPTRSYGLVVRLDSQYEPRASFHSRADGRRHGVTSCLEVGGRLIATSKGGDVIVSLPLPEMKWS